MGIYTYYFYEIVDAKGMVVLRKFRLTGSEWVESDLNQFKVKTVGPCYILPTKIH